MRALIAKPLHRWLIAGVLLSATVSTLVTLAVTERGRAATEIAAAIAARRAQLADIVSGQLQALELRGSNAGSNPRLVAALSGNVSRDTLRDLFQTESWWQPFREAFAATYLAAPGGKPVFITGKAEAALASAGEVTALVTRARQSRTVTSGLVSAAGWAHVVVAVPVHMPSGPSPVLLLSHPFDAAQVNQIAERSGAGVVLSDGKQALVGAGPAAETTVAKQAIGHETNPLAPALFAPGGAIAVAGVAPGLYLLSHVATKNVVAHATAGLALVRIVVGLLGGGAFLFLVFTNLRRRKATPVPAAEAPLAATVTDAGSGGRYVLLQRIGGGGMAEVHLAVSVGERGFRRPCVVKRLRPELSSNQQAVAQFTDEATLASSLVHANIVPIFDFARIGSQYLLVEEYIVGRDLGRVVRRARAVGKPMTTDLVAYIAVEALKALDYAHSKRDHDGAPLGIVHRDVSPENLMVTVRGEVQLLDFGVMKVDEARVGRTDLGELKGNLTYIAPEQARGLEVDGRADLFSLGQVIYFALTGEPLYGIEGGYDLLVRAASGPGPSELAKIAKLPEPFANMLTHVLSPRPEGRYPNAMAFAEALAPYTNDAATRLGMLVAELFGDELAEEQQHLSATALSRTAVTTTGVGTGFGTGVGTGSSSGQGQPAALGPAATPIARLPAARGN